jgi:hypothetical protein
MAMREVNTPNGTAFLLEEDLINAHHRCLGGLEEKKHMVALMEHVLTGTPSSTTKDDYLDRLRKNMEELKSVIAELVRVSWWLESPWKLDEESKELVEGVPCDRENLGYKEDLAEAIGMKADRLAPKSQQILLELLGRISFPQ